MPKLDRTFTGVFMLLSLRDEKWKTLPLAFVQKLPRQKFQAFKSREDCPGHDLFQESVLPEGPAAKALQEMTKPKRIAITDSFWLDLSWNQFQMFQWFNIDKT